MDNKIIVNTDNFKAFGVITELFPEKIDESVGKPEKEKANRSSTAGLQQTPSNRSRKKKRSSNHQSSPLLPVPKTDRLNADRDSSKADERISEERNSSAPKKWADGKEESKRPETIEEHFAESIESPDKFSIIRPILTKALGADQNPEESPSAGTASSPQPSSTVGAKDFDNKINLR